MRKKLFTFFLAIVASVGTLFAESGTCGDNLTWDLTDGVLTITGTGQMRDYFNNSDVPWCSNRSSIITVNINDGVTSIGIFAFYNCNSLTSVTIPNSVTCIEQSAFSGCTSLTSVTIPSSVTYIRDLAFYNCNSLTSISIPNAVKSIGDYAFWNCSSLTSVTLGNSVAYIGESAFRECSSLTSISIPNRVTGIADYTFYNCSRLASVTIPEGVTRIGQRVFEGCGSLSSITIPNSITQIGDYVFEYCNNLPVIDNVQYAGTYLVKVMDETLSEYTIREGTKWIGHKAFYGCHNLVSINIPEGVTNIEYSAFSDCSALTSVTIPSSVMHIASEAFRFCGKLNAVHISDIAAWCAINMGSYYANPLIYAHNLYLNSVLVTDLVIPEGVTIIHSDVFPLCTCLTSVTIPNSVTEIRSGAFSGCSGISSIVFGNGITEIEGFDHCTSLTSVAIPNSVTSIGGSAFHGCSSLTSVTIPNSVTSIENDVFRECINLTSITIPNSVTSIGNHAFHGCSSLNSVTIPNSVTSIENDVFRECTNLTSVTIPNSVTSIRSHAFHGCSSLTSITIPGSVTYMGDYAFSYCNGLTSVTIPSSVTKMGNDVFSYCSTLSAIFMQSATPPIIASMPTNGISNAVIVFVPIGSKNRYLSADYWKEMNILEPYSVDVIFTPTGTSIKFIHNLWQYNGNYVASIGIQGGEQQPGNVLEYIGLEPNSEYKDIPVVLTSNTGETETINVSFTTTALELTTKPSKPVSSTTAILLAETNMSDAEVSCGFEYKRNDAPADMDGTKVFCPVASGQMAGRLKNLKDDVYYKYRAFYQSAAGNMYYGDWQYIFTGDVAVEFDPILYTYGATVVRENEATISGYALAGSEDFTEQGFEYWAESRTNNGANAPHHIPAALGEHFFVQASGIALRATLTNLDAGTVYKYRVYGKVGDQYYYGSEQAFTTTGTYTPPTYTITFANWDGATLQSSQVEEGTLPEYTGATPERPEDEQYIYTFNGWSPAIVAATADATYTAQYVSKDKHEGLGEVPSDQVQSTKLLRNGVLYIERNGKTYTVTGAEVK